MTMTPEQAYNELVDVYIETTKNRLFHSGHIRTFAKTYESWAKLCVIHHNWTYRRAKQMVDRCRELAPLALQHQP